MKVIVTGGAGYCGVPLCRSLLERGHSVKLVDNFTHGIGPILSLLPHDRFEAICRDVRDEDRSYLDVADAVFHLAGLSGYPACDAQRHAAYAINVDASRRIARRLSPSQFLIFPSSTSFYGSSGAMVTEGTVPAPASLYGQTKWQAEQAIMERRNTIALRFATVFGVSERMRWDLMVNDFVRRATSERAIVLYHADSRRAFIHIDDVVRAYLFTLDRAMSMAGGIYNVGSNRLNASKREIAECVRKDCPCDIFEATSGATDIRNFVVSYARIEALGFRCEQTLDGGIRQLLKASRIVDSLSARGW